MSNSLAIAAVTATLRNLLAQVATVRADDPDNELSDTQVTTVTPDKAGAQEDHNQINLYLYQLLPNPAGRNLDGSGKTGRAPGLSLDLYYLVSVYGRNHNEILAQRVLGRAMSLLHSHPTLLAADLAAAVPGADVQAQTERVRIHPHALGGEEMVRMWGTFQVKHRLSVAYRVGMVLIDHEAPGPVAPDVKQVAFGVAPDPTRPAAKPETTTSGDGGGTA